MFRARLALVVAACSLALSGCCHCCSEHPFLDCLRDRFCSRPSAPCCEPSALAGSSPIVDGPILMPQAENGTLPLGPAPKVVTPQAKPMPYTP